jgi:CRP-like cAMP-binding protein
MVLRFEECNRQKNGNCTNLHNSEARLEKLAPLDKIGWLADQPLDFRLWAAEAGRWRAFKAGQFVYHAGDRSDGIYGLGSGSLHITFPLIAEEAVIIHRGEVGFWIGDNAELAAVPRLVSLAAATDCRLYYLPSRAVQGLLKEAPAHWSSFYALSAINVKVAVSQLSEVLALSVRARVCRRLLDLSQSFSVVDVTQEELAKLVGVTRGTLRRCLDDLEAMGATEWRYRRLHILNRETLAIYKDEQ